MSEKIEERIRELKERLAQTTPNKHTQKSINFLRAQLAKLRDDLVRIASSKKGGKVGFGVKKSGDSQVAFIGFPSVGKSSLLNLLTRGATRSKVASYEFTTTTAIPGIMEIEHARVQLVDLPGVILGAAIGKGRGKEVLGAVRSADLILILICFQEDGSVDFTDLHSIREELHDAGIRLNQKPARIVIQKKERGGVGLTTQGPQLMDRNEVRSLLKELNILNAAVYFHEPRITAEQLVDHVLGNRVYTRELVVINKVDLARDALDPAEITAALGHEHWLPISVMEKYNIGALRHKIFEELRLIRVFLKPPGREADLEEPLILPRGATLETLCRKIHKSFLQQFRYALVWGTSAKHPGQKFSSLEHVIADNDIVSIYVKR